MYMILFFFFSQADIILFPFMERFALAMPEFSSYDFRSNSDEAINKWLVCLYRTSTSCSLFANVVGEAPTSSTNGNKALLRV